jgi:TonB family protein
MKTSLLGTVAFLICGVGFAQVQVPPPEQNPSPNAVNSTAGEIISDTMGTDFGPYLKPVIATVGKNWLLLIPPEARPPRSESGEVTIEFHILHDGQVKEVKVTGSSGHKKLDRGAYGGVTSSNPLPPLPDEFAGQYLGLRLHFWYNPRKGDNPRPPESSQSSSSPQ